VLVSFDSDSIECVSLLRKTSGKSVTSYSCFRYVIIISVARNYQDNRCTKQTGSTKRSTGNRAALTSLKVISGLPCYVACEMRFSQKGGMLGPFTVRLFSKPFST